jgi:hypothetical protein
MRPQRAYARSDMIPLMKNETQHVFSENTCVHSDFWHCVHNDTRFREKRAFWFLKNVQKQGAFFLQKNLQFFVHFSKNFFLRVYNCI